ncbi:MAG: AAA family ATPase, partial [Desulfobacterales bacterium]|nr:AAA family ATPase [Desulfobacterales bacterium]
MQSLFEVKFPLVVKWEDKFTVTFNLQKGNALEFKSGVYLLHGDNGSGKTTFLNLLALTAGNIGKGGKTGTGAVAYNGEAYNSPDFNHIRAA